MLGSKVRRNVDLLKGLEARAPVFTGKNGLVAQLLLNAQQLIVLAQTLGTAWGTSLDLTSFKANDEIGNEGVLGLARAMGDHDTPL